MACLGLELGLGFLDCVFKMCVFSSSVTPLFHNNQSIQFISSVERKLLIRCMT